MISLGQRGDGAWRPPVLKTVASQGEGIAELVAAIEKHRDWLAESGVGVQRRQRGPARRSRRSRWRRCRRASAASARRDALEQLAADVAAGPDRRLHRRRPDRGRCRGLTRPD